MSQSRPGSRLVRRGDRGPAVADIRATLAGLGLLPDATAATGGLQDATFDEACEHAVRAFQQHRGLSSDGLVGPDTYRALDEARWRLGDRVLTWSPAHLLHGDDVTALQERLNELGFDAGRTDGVFGQRTAAALADFQRNRGLSPDGTLGPQTLRELVALSRKVVGGRPHFLRESEDLHRAGPTLVGKAVVVDPGHGGSDRGIVANGLDEASIVHDLAARLEARLLAAGMTAYLTHGPDACPTDQERADLANDTAADLVVSLHVDACRTPAASGVATYHYGHQGHQGHPGGGGPSSTVGERLAQLVQREVVARTGLVDCRSHPKTWPLLRLTRMPAVRLELGHLTSPEDAARLGDPAFRDIVAEAVLVAVQRLYLPVDLDPPTGSLRLPAVVGQPG